MLTPYDWVYGISQIAAVVLSLFVALIGISLFQISLKKKQLHAWKFLLIALIFFTAEEVFGTLKTFGILTNISFITHIIPSFIMGFLITALIIQIQVNKGWLK
jgi:FtsH-binding integral membrane protein